MPRILNERLLGDQVKEPNFFFKKTTSTTLVEQKKLLLLEVIELTSVSTRFLADSASGALTGR